MKHKFWIAALSAAMLTACAFGFAACDSGNGNGTEQGGTEQEGTEQGGSQQGGTEQGGTEQGGTEQGGTEQGGTEQGGTEQGGTEQKPATVGLAYVLINGDTEYEVSHIGIATDMEIVIPATYNGLPVTSIADFAFGGCEELTSVTIPDSVTSIGEECFSDCSNLTSVTIGNGVTSIGYGAFYSCHALKDITIPDSVTSIGGFAFGGGLTEIVIPSGVTSIGEGVFTYCNDLTDIVVEVDNPVYHSAGNCLIETASKTLIAGCGSSVIPNDGSVTSIGNYAFRGLRVALTEIIIPGSIRNIGNYAFETCQNLTSIIIPDSVLSIGNDAFNSCSGLTSVTIGNGVTSIGNYAFRGCSELMSVYYMGTAAEWEEIIIGSFNSELTDATLYYYSVTQPTGSGNYWHYDTDGVTPVVWGAPSVTA